MILFLHAIAFGPVLLILYLAIIGIIWTRDFSFALKLKYSSLITIAALLLVISWGLPSEIKEFASWQIIIVGVGFLVSLLVGAPLPKRKNPLSNEAIRR